MFDRNPVVNDFIWIFLSLDYLYITLSGATVFLCQSRYWKIDSRRHALVLLSHAHCRSLSKRASQNWQKKPFFLLQGLFSTLLAKLNIFQVTKKKYLQSPYSLFHSRQLRMNLELRVDSWYHTLSCWIFSYDIKVINLKKKNKRCLLHVGLTFVTLLFLIFW